MNYKELLAKALARAQELSKAAEDRDLSEDELSEVKSVTDEIADLKSKVKAAEDGAALLKQLGDMGKQVTDAGDGEKAAKSLGEHFVKHVGVEGLRRVKSVSRSTVSAPEFKAASDTQETGGSSGAWADAITQVDRNIVTGVRRRLTIADLLGSGTLSGQAITYFVEGALEGTIGTTSEAAAGDQIHFADPTQVTESLTKILAFIKESSEMMEDLDFVVSAINGRLLYNVGLTEENQLLSGNGSAPNLRGILNRTGIQTESAASTDDNPDALFRAMTKVSTGSGLDADGIVIHPTDYQTLRLMKDSNNQYFGGGFFQGEYGNGGVAMQPPLWGLRTVVTPAVSVGTVVVGAWQQAATLYRKGGVTVEATNSDGTDFESDVVTIRAKERLALAVRKPAGFVKVTLASTGGSSSGSPSSPA